MANIKSAKKRMRQNIVRRQRNRQHLRTLRTQIKKFRSTLAEGDIEGASSLLSSTYSKIDKSIQKGIIHRNTAARLKSRLSAGLAKAKS